MAQTSGGRQPAFVGGSAEVKRVLELPTRSDDQIPDYTPMLRRPGGTFSLRKEQNEALWQLATWGGLVAEITMGGGKGLVCMAAPYLLARLGHQIQRPLVVVPANLESTFWREYSKFKKHFFLATNLRLVSYEKLSTDPEYLDKYSPDLILFDEADKLRNPKSARGRRLFTYLHDTPTCRVAFLSGTFTRRSVKEYAHLVGYALRQYSFVPQKRTDIEAWAQVLDDAASPDAESLRAFRSVIPGGLDLTESRTGKRHVQAWYRDRRTTAPGSVVSHGDDGVQAALVFRERQVEVPAEVEAAMKELASSWTKPDGDEQESSLAIWQTMRQLAFGAYYLWDWPKDEAGEYIKDTYWLERRSTWHRAIRRTLQLERKGIDSPLQVARYVHTPEGADEMPDVRQALDAWTQVRHIPPPPTRCVWLSGFLLDAAVEWLLEKIASDTNGIIWFQHRAVGQALRARGVPTFMDSGQDFDVRERFCAASISQHGRGKNLQESHSNNLLLEMPGTHDVMEQLLARTHRPGQLAAEVEIAYFAHTDIVRESLRSLWSQAGYVEATTGKTTRTRRGVWENPSWKEDDE